MLRSHLTSSAPRSRGGKTTFQASPKSTLPWDFLFFFYFPPHLCSSPLSSQKCFLPFLSLFLSSPPFLLTLISAGLSSPFRALLLQSTYFLYLPTLIQKRRGTRASFQATSFRGLRVHTMAAVTTVVGFPDFRRVSSSPELKSYFAQHVHRRYGISRKFSFLWLFRRGCQHHPCFGTGLERGLVIVFELVDMFRQVSCFSAGASFLLQGFFL